MINKESVRKGSIATSFLNILGRSIGFISIFLISYFFGANHKTDIYYFLFSVVSIVAALFTSVQSAVMSPLFIKVNKNKGDVAAWAFKKIQAMAA